MASSLEALLASHRLTLTSLYTTLSPSPAPLLDSALDTLNALLTSTISTQLAAAEAEVASAQQRLTEGWKKVADWRTALGESPVERTEEAGKPLLSSITEVEGVLAGMRGRMEERGNLIVGLQRRLGSFKAVLGSEWLKVELEDVETGWEGLDLRLERMSTLEREVMRCDAEIATRRAIINANVTEIFAIRSELGIHQDSTTPASATHSADAANAPVSDPFDEAILSHLGVGEAREKKEMLPTSENLLRVEAKRKWLEEEKDHRNALIQSTYDKLYPLWTMLGVSETEMEDFVNKWMGSTSDVVNAYQTELARMLTLKRSNLSSFIDLERSSLTALWDTLYLSPAQRLASFPPFAISVQPSRVWNAVIGAEEDVVNDNVSEELLVAHERERERVEGEVEASRPVLERMARYFSVVEEMRELEASASDPSRLLGKSTRGDPGRLLREEKARKRVIKEKPKLELELRQIIPVWEREHARPFLVNGVRFLDDLDHKIEAEALEKENKKRAKAGASAISSSTRTVPLRAQHTGAASANSIVPIKRQMTGAPSASKAPAAKRQVPMATGPRAAPVLGEIGNAHSREQHAPVAAKLLSQSTGRIGLGSGTGGGMKIPSGWGGVAATGVAPIDGSTGHPHAVAYIQPQPTGGFRPRSSTMSGSGAGSTTSFGR